MLLKNLRDEIAATLARDPAARSRLEVVLCYPGFHAVLLHRSQMRSAREEHHIRASPGEPRADIAADGAGAGDDDSHVAFCE